MSGAIFLKTSDGQLARLSSTEYLLEEELQELLARFPDLIPGEQISPSTPRRWLLIGREVPIPGDEGGAGRWSIDHVFLDQDGVPTLVEVKRSTNTQIRREVVGQMLDYAANAVSYWHMEHLQSQFAQTCAAAGVDPDAALNGFIGDRDTDEFWKTTKTNLQAGRIRMIFVADAIPPELRRVVEFLNEQTDPAEVLAVEVPQYSDGEHQTLVPKLVGQTAQAEQRKSAGRPGRTWDKHSFMADLGERLGDDATGTARALIEWSLSRGARAKWGSGAQNGSFSPIWDIGNLNINPFVLWTAGGVEMQFQWVRDRPPFDEKPRRQELLDRLNRIPGIELPQDGIERRPGFPYSAISRREVRESFVAVIDWVVSETEAFHSRS